MSQKNDVRLANKCWLHDASSFQVLTNSYVTQCLSSFLERLTPNASRTDSFSLTNMTPTSFPARVPSFAPVIWQVEFSTVCKEIYIYLDNTTVNYTEREVREGICSTFFASNFPPKNFNQGVNEAKGQRENTWFNPFPPHPPRPTCVPSVTFKFQTRFLLWAWRGGGFYLSLCDKLCALFHASEHPRREASRFQRLSGVATPFHTHTWNRMREKMNNLSGCWCF